MKKLYYLVVVNLGDTDQTTQEEGRMVLEEMLRLAKEYGEEIAGFPMPGKIEVYVLDPESQVAKPEMRH